MSKLDDYKARAREILRTYDSRFETDDPALASAIASEMLKVREETIDEAGDVCDREEAACLRHATALRGVKPRSRVDISTAHEMAGQQSKACGAYVRQLVER